MGNRTIISLKHNDEHSPCSIYLHWNGGPESTQAFFNATYDFMALMNRSGDLEYFTARFIQAVTMFMGGSLSVGIVPKHIPSSDDKFLDNPPLTYDIGNRLPDLVAAQSDDEYIRKTRDKYRYVYTETFDCLLAMCHYMDLKYHKSEAKDAIDYMVQRMQHSWDSVLQEEKEAIL